MRYLTARLGLLLIICSFSMNTYAQNVAPAIEDPQILEQLIAQKNRPSKISSMIQLTWTFFLSTLISAFWLEI